MLSLFLAACQLQLLIQQASDICLVPKPQVNIDASYSFVHDALYLLPAHHRVLSVHYHRTDGGSLFLLVIELE